MTSSSRSNWLCTAVLRTSLHKLPVSLACSYFHFGRVCQRLPQQIICLHLTPWPESIFSCESLWGRMQTATSRRMSPEEAFSWSPKCTWPMLRDRCGCSIKITVWMCFFKLQAGLLHRPYTQEQAGDVGLEYFFFFHTQIRGYCELLLNWTLSVLYGLQNVQSAYTNWKINK